MGDLYFEIGLVISGIAVALLGWYLLPGQRRSLFLTLAGLFFLAALLSTLLDLGFSLRWRDPLSVVAQQQREPSVGIPEVTVPMGLPSPIPSLTPRPTLPPTPTVPPTPTEPPTITPTPSPTVPPSPTPTSTITPTPTPVPPQRRLEYREQEERVHAVLIEDFEAGTEEIIYTERSPLPVYSAAWSLDGSQILMALRWYVSDDENGAKLVLYDVQAAESENLLVLDMAQQDAAMGNALWAPSGEQVALYLEDENEGGVYLLNVDGTDLQRLPNSVPGEWPRYWSVDEQWIVTVNTEGALYALGSDGQLRLPLAEAGTMQIYDQRYDPWRILPEARCDVQDDSWWKCK